ncbi:uncharacterized protein LOC120293829 [Eucalyptus grandis]|uniref:uncharacterized protein LOC120293829 n=1 Tax=Eucalyptus grandis TaxID=71139 RepID=UPI00192ED033|nr:uncharacterized protein LOC120293829 [Eucalyptus grandis]
MQGLVEQFLKLKPSKFASLGDPSEAEVWIDEMEKSFTLLNCTDVEKVSLAKYQLLGNAYHWLKAMKGTVFPEGAEVTWASFVWAFFGKHFSDCARDNKVMEFMQLTQNNLMVDQYEVRFVELSRFAPKLVEDREDKAKTFLNGMRPNIRRHLVPPNLKDYHELYECAQILE